MQIKMVRVAAAVLVTVLIATSCGNLGARKAVEVNDAVIASHRSMMESLEAFVSALNQRDSAQIHETLTGLRTSAEAGLETTEALEGLRCDEGFLTAAAAMFDFYARTAESEYADIARYYSRDSISYGQYDSLQLIIREVEESQETADAAFLEAQQAFAASCGFKLVRNAD